jgi:hypothetical protein
MGARNPNNKHGPSADRFRALRVLAASPGGCSEAIMLAHGFKLELLVELIRDGLATALVERVRAGRREIKITRLQITAQGRRALSEGKE